MNPLHGVERNWQHSRRRLGRECPGIHYMELKVRDYDSDKPAVIYGIHYMELKVETFSELPPKPPIGEESITWSWKYKNDKKEGVFAKGLRESITWSWKIFNWPACWTSTSPWIHYMELKDSKCYTEAELKFETRIHYMELKGVIRDARAVT